MTLRDTLSQTALEGRDTRPRTRRSLIHVPARTWHDFCLLEWAGATWRVADYRLESKSLCAYLLETDSGIGQNFSRGRT